MVTPKLSSGILNVIRIHKNQIFYVPKLTAFSAVVKNGWKRIEFYVWRMPTHTKEASFHSWSQGSYSQTTVITDGFLATTSCDTRSKKLQ